MASSSLIWMAMETSVLVGQFYTFISMQSPQSKLVCVYPLVMWLAIQRVRVASQLQHTCTLPAGIMANGFRLTAKPVQASYMIS